MKLVSIPANPVPAQAVCGTLKTPDGVDLRFARWMPTQGRRGTVVVLQGRAEFIEKYFETVTDLRSRGFAVVTFDWRGQGLSDHLLSNRSKGYVRRFADYLVDLETIMKDVVLPDCPPPIFALGHSMGGAILIEAAHDGSRWFDRIVLSAPLIALPPSPMNRMAGPLARLLRMLGRGGTSATASGGSEANENFAGNNLTSDPVRFARNAAILAEEPALGLGPPTIAWADSVLRVLKRFADSGFASKIRQPILMIAAGRDQVVSTRAIETFGANLLAGRNLTIAGARHEILQEQDEYRDQFWAAFDAFVPGTPRY
jgi:lysophospholipase